MRRQITRSFIVLVLLGTSLHADTYMWNSSVPFADIQTATNWTPNTGPPGSNDDAIMPTITQPGPVIVPAEPQLNTGATMSLATMSVTGSGGMFCSILGDLTFTGAGCNLAASSTSNAVFSMFGGSITMDQGASTNSGSTYPTGTSFIYDLAGGTALNFKGDSDGAGIIQVLSPCPTCSINLLNTVNPTSIVTVGALTGQNSKVNIAAGATFNIGSATGGTYAGTITGGGKLVKQPVNNVVGSNSQTLTGNVTLNTVTVDGGTLILQGTNTFNAVTNNTALMQINGPSGTFSGNVTINGTSTFDLSGYVPATATIGDLNGTGNLTLGVTNLITGTSTPSATFSGDITGSGYVEKTGSGTLFLSGTVNTYGGGTQLNQGTLGVTADGSLGANGTVLSVTGSPVTLSILSSTTFAQHPIALGSNTLTINTGGNTVGWNRLISGAGNLVKDGTGSASDTLSLGFANTYGGTTTITHGGLIAAVNNAIPTTSRTSVSSGCSLTLNTGVSQTLSYINVVSSSKVVLNSSSNLIINSPTTTAADASLIAGIVSGSGSVTVGSTLQSNLTLSNSSNSYTGPTNVAFGTLTAGNTDVISHSSQLNLGSGVHTGKFDLAGHDNSIQSLGPGTAGSSITLGSAQLTINQATGTTTFLGFITDNGASPGGSVVYDGAAGSNLILAGNNSFTGGFTVNSGKLTLSGANAIGTGTTQINGGTLAIAGPGTITGNIFIATPGVFDISGATLISTINIGTLAGSGTVDLGGNILNTTTSGTTTFSGLIQDTGGSPGTGGQLKVSGNGTLILAGSIPNTYTGGTTLNGATLQINSDGSLGAPGTTLNVTANSTLRAGAAGISSTRPITLNNSNLIFDNNSFNMTWGGVISDNASGSITKTGAGTLFLTNTANTYHGGTNLNQGTLQIAADGSLGYASGPLNVTGAATLQAAPSSSITSNRPTHLGNNALTIDTNGTNMTWNGVIDDTRSGSLTKIGAGTLTLTGANTYRGGTRVSAGTLQGNTTSLQGNIINNATLVFNDPPGTNIFRGAISGTGTTNKISNDTLVFNTDQSAFSGTTNIQAGTLSLNNILGGTLNIDSGATLIGNGTVGRNLTIFSGGTISPGPGIGTITVGGNYAQQVNATYIWESYSTTQNDLITVNGLADLAGDLNVEFSGPIVFNTPYPILHADGGVNGTFTNTFNVPSFSNPYVVSGIFYTGTDVFLEFKTIFGQFNCNGNAQRIANQLDSITNPTPDIIAVITEFATVPTSGLCDALNDLAGSQFTFMPQLARYSNERFNQAIYNTIRSTLLPCWCPDPCDRIQTWFMAETGHCFAGNDTNCKGMKSTNWDLSAGSHMLVCNGLIAGVAASYQRDYVSFHQGGSTTRDTGQAAIYGIARGDMFYLYGDAIFGMTSGKFKRPIAFGTFSTSAKSRPQTTQGLVYGEAGLNYCMDCGCNLLVQPFLAAEYGHYLQKRFAECNAGDFDLIVKSKTANTFDTYLGVHLFGTIGDVNVSADVAWQHRFNYATFKNVSTFEGFGSSFSIHGSNIGTDGVRGSINASVRITDTLNFYADIFGERWKNWAAHGADLGVALWW